MAKFPVMTLLPVLVTVVPATTAYLAAAFKFGQAMELTVVILKHSRTLRAAIGNILCNTCCRVMNG